MGVSRTLSDVNGDFGGKSQKKTFPPLRVFNAPDEGGVPLGNGGGAQKIVIPLPDDGKSLCTRLDTILDG